MDKTTDLLIGIVFGASLLLGLFVFVRDGYLTRKEKKAKQKRMRDNG